MSQCQGCGKFMNPAEGICCSKCPGQFHRNCTSDINGDAICCKCNKEQNLSASTNAEPTTSQSSESGIVYHGVNRDLTCILFPGVVKNVDKALQCLGGIKSISQVYSQSTKKRLGLSFQPENPFVKKIYADHKNTAGVLLKIKVKKIKVNNKVERQVISTDVVGRVSNIYRFESMSDFQYLPIFREAPEEPLKCLIDKIVPSGCDTKDFIPKYDTAPQYLVPACFTRSDKPISYAYTDKRYPDRSGSPDGDSEYHVKSRSERGMPLGYWWRFNLTDEFPTTPDEFYINMIKTKAEYNTALLKEYEIIKKCFEDRPIWSLNLIRCTTKIRLSSLKVLVPCVAIFMKDGPWRSLWVRYGFDPRIQHSAMIYQTLDFRLRHTAGVHSMVTVREPTGHYKGLEHSHRRNRFKRSETELVPEAAVIFRPGVPPAQRQIFYQLCDIKLPEVEQLINEASADVTSCHEKLGWLPPKTIDECRDHIFRSVKKTLLATYSEELKYEDDGDGGSSDEDDNSGDDIINSMDDSIQ